MIYKEIWNSSIGDTITRKQPENPKNRFAVTVMSDDKEVGRSSHLKNLKDLINLFIFFLRASKEIDAK